MLDIWKSEQKRIFYFPAVTLTGSAAGDAALDKFNKSWTELDDWLTLLDHMVQTQRVMVGDLDEINDMTVKLKVSLCRHLAALNPCPQKNTCCPAVDILYTFVTFLSFP